jgi:hypothetical protein
MLCSWPTRFFAAVASLLACAFGAGAANASPVSLTIDFSATGFIIGFGATGPAPVDPVIGQLSITFDPPIAITNDTIGITVLGLNISLGSPAAFDYDPCTQIMLIGGLQNGVGTVASFTNDFELQIGAAADPGVLFERLQYTTMDRVGRFVALAGFLSVGPAAVPEPAPLLLIATGLRGLVGCRRHR